MSSTARRLGRYAMAWRRQCLAGVGVLPLIIAGCTADSASEDSAIGGVSVDSAFVRESASVGRISLPVGAVLLGSPIPASVVEHGGTVWTAVLVLKGDPLEVYDSLVEEVGALGFGFIPDAAHACTPLTADGLTTTNTELVTGVRCDAHLTLRGDEGEANFDISISYGTRSDASAFASHAVLTYDDVLPPGGEPVPNICIRSDPDSDRGCLEDAVDPAYMEALRAGAHAPRPDKGRSLRADEETLAQDLGVELRAGTHLIGPVAPVGPCNGATALMRSSAEPRDVVSDYALAFDPAWDDSRLKVEANLTVAHVETGLGPAKAVVASAPDEPSGDWLVLLQRCEG